MNTLPKEYVVHSPNPKQDLLDAFSIHTKRNPKWVEDNFNSSNCKYAYFVFRENYILTDYYTIIVNNFAHLPVIQYEEWKKLYKNRKVKMGKLIGDPCYLYITKNKHYEILDEDKKYNTYKIIDDVKQEIWISCEKFSLIPTKEIIGYSSPFDLFDGKIAKGSLFVPVSGVNGVKEGLWYAHGESAKTTSYAKHIPKEIVETWTPVYKEENLKLEVKGVNIEIDEKGNIYFDFKGNKGNSTIKILKGIWTAITSNLDSLGEFEVKINSVHIGCTEGLDLNSQEIGSILNKFDTYFA